MRSGRVPLVLIAVWIGAVWRGLSAVPLSKESGTADRQGGESEFVVDVTWADDMSVDDRAGFESCIEEAKRVLKDSWPSIVPVYVQVEFLNEQESETFQGYGFGRFTTARSVDGVTHTIAAAEAIAGTDLNSPGDPDVSCVFSTTPQWHTDVSSAPPFAESVDFLTTLLHEIMHGLIFAGLAQEFDGGIRYGGAEPLAFDRHVGSLSRECIIDGVFGANPDWSQPNSEALQALTASDDVGFFILEDNGTISTIPLLSTSPFQAGRSLYHFRDWTESQPRALMIPSLPSYYSMRELDDDLLRIQAAILAGASTIPIRPCPPGTFSGAIASELPLNPEGGGGDPEMIGSLPMTTFIIIVAVSSVLVITAVLICVCCCWVRSERRRLKREQRRMHGEAQEWHVRNAFIAQQLRREHSDQKSRLRRKLSIRRAFSRATDREDPSAFTTATTTATAPTGAPAPNGQYYGTSSSPSASLSASKQASLSRGETDRSTDRSEPNSAGTTQNNTNNNNHHHYYQQQQQQQHHIAASRIGSEPRARAGSHGKTGPSWIRDDRNDEPHGLTSVQPASRKASEPRSRVSSHGRTSSRGATARRANSLGVHRAQMKPISTAPYHNQHSHQQHHHHSSSGTPTRLSSQGHNYSQRSGHSSPYRAATPTQARSVCGTPQAATPTYGHNYARRSGSGSRSSYTPHQQPRTAHTRTHAFQHYSSA